MDRLEWVLLCAFLAAVSLAIGILIGAFRAHRKMMAEEEKFTPTHRRTREKP
jgi:uncharacterized protein YneF (UPF0154 family)